MELCSGKAQHRVLRQKTHIPTFISILTQLLIHCILLSSTVSSRRGAVRSDNREGGVLGEGGGEDLQADSERGSRVPFHGGDAQRLEARELLARQQARGFPG